MEKNAVEIQTGQKVRIHTSQFAGKIGSITALNVKPVELPNGIRTTTASVLLQNNENVMLPFSNFDIIETES
jgi:transcription antitermination factor NusG